VSLDGQACGPAVPQQGPATGAQFPGDAFLSRRATGGLLQAGAAPQRRAGRFLVPPLT
jgi:hypothetical protein